MIELQPYPAMKNSGVEWLGEVPAHWEVTRLSRVVHSTNAGEVIDKGWWGKGQEILYTCARARLISDFDSFPQTKRTTGKDLLLTRNGTPYVHRPVANAIYSNVVQRINLQTGLGREWIARALEAATRSMKGYGVSIESLNYDMWKVLVVLLPPQAEQAAIVRYLDYVDRRVRRLVRAKRKLIALLTEQRQVIIHRAVTRGLDPDVPMKDSGVEWLGKVPEHWSELPLKRIARFDNSGSYGVEPEQGKNVLPVATTAQIGRDGKFAVERMPRRGFSDRDLERYRCNPGDILVVKSSGSIFNVISGKTGIVLGSGPRFVFGNFLLRVRSDQSRVDPEYLVLLLAGHLTRERVKRMVAGTTYPNLRVGEYTAALLPVPPLSEQAAVVAHLAQTTANIDIAVAWAGREIDLLNEYRSRLIADVVTGKLDVRSAAARLPRVDPLDTEDERLEDTFDTAAEEEADSSEEAAER